MRTSFLIFASILVIFASACSTARSSRSGADGSVDSGGGSDAGFSENCPSSRVQDFFTCTSTTNGAVCPGTMFCDSCSMNVATACTCMPYEAGYQFRCADPCEGCGASGDAGVDSGRLEPDASEPGPGSCVVMVSGTMFCHEFASSVSSSTATSECATMFEGTFVSSCPLGRTGGCRTLEPPGTLWVYSTDILTSLMSECVESGGTWVEAP